MWVKKNSNFKILLSYWLSFNAHQSVSILKFDWDDLSPIFLTTMLLHYLKVF